MKTLNKIVVIILASYMMVNCEEKPKQITNQKDYNKYLDSKDSKSIDFSTSEIDFWQKKYDKTPNQTTYLSQIASNYSKLFEITGNIDYLTKVEELLLKSNEALKYSNVGTIRSLGRNYITQHRFKEALVLANKALAIGEGMKESHRLLFDVNMELGNYADAEKNLNFIKDFKDFDYLIRVSKWSDHNGDLKAAISFMEKAKIAAQVSKNKNLTQWTYSNLGDLNGHDGNIQASYDYYLKTLALEPNDSYALKGLAWITFSHEKNTAEAKRIISKISKKHNTPDFYLLKSKIAEFENNSVEEKENLAMYFKMLENDKYGVMYNKYNTLQYADNKNTASKALEIAEVEVQNRPTPDSYDLLAWAYYNLGDVKKAYQIMEEFVYGKSHEPLLNYHVAVIYKANNRKEITTEIKEELLGSLYELGPNYKNKIDKL